MFRRILVPIDGSPPSRRGLDEAIALAKDQAARLCLLHVVDESIVTRTFDGTTYMPARYIDDFMKSLRSGEEAPHPGRGQSARPAHQDRHHTA